MSDIPGISIKRQSNVPLDFLNMAAKSKSDTINDIQKGASNGGNQVTMNQALQAGQNVQNADSGKLYTQTVSPSPPYRAPNMPPAGNPNIQVSGNDSVTGYVPFDNNGVKMIPLVDTVTSAGAPPIGKLPVGLENISGQTPLETGHSPNPSNIGGRYEDYLYANKNNTLPSPDKTPQGAGNQAPVNVPSQDRGMPVNQDATTYPGQTGQMLSTMQNPNFLKGFNVGPSLMDAIGTALQNVRGNGQSGDKLTAYDQALKTALASQEAANSTYANNLSATSLQSTGAQTDLQKQLALIPANVRAAVEEATGKAWGTLAPQEALIRAEMIKNLSNVPKILNTNLNPDVTAFQAPNKAR